jgi:hypothetical protein
MFTTDVGFFEIHFHKAQLARDSIGKRVFLKQMDDQLKALSTDDQLLMRSID